MHAKTAQLSGQTSVLLGLVVECHVGVMEQYASLVFLVKVAAIEIHIGQINWCKLVVGCHAGVMEQCVLLELLVTAVAMETHFGQIGVLLKHVV
jgi:hypothetical protein